MLASKVSLRRFSTAEQTQAELYYPGRTRKLAIDKLLLKQTTKRIYSTTQIDLQTSKLLEGIRIEILVAILFFTYALASLCSFCVQYAYFAEKPHVYGRN